MLVLMLAFWMAADRLDFQFFVKRVEPIFLKNREGAARCYNCHSLDSNKAPFHLEPLGPDGTWTEEQSRRNFENARKLVEAGDPFHTGGKFWKSKDDPEWRILAQWVNGEKLR
jgi:hypothetical protein